jgi:hypothetical protein
MHNDNYFTMPIARIVSPQLRPGNPRTQQLDLNISRYWLITHFIICTLLRMLFVHQHKVCTQNHYVTPQWLMLSYTITSFDAFRRTSLGNHRARVIIVRAFMENGREPSSNWYFHAREARESCYCFASSLNFHNQSCRSPERSLPWM